MLKDQRWAWIAIGVLVLTFLLNAIIINIAYVGDHNLFRMLIISIPLLIIAIYNAWHTNHLFQKHFNESRSTFTPQGYSEWWSHSIYSNSITQADLKVQIGNDQCCQPYNSCIFNVGSMEATDLESTFNQEAKENDLEYSENSVGKTLNTYQLAAGGLVWQIESGYRGCRTENGHFNSKAFKKTASKPEVKMIELKLSSAIKPVDPVVPFSGFAESGGKKIDKSIFSGSSYTTFRDAEGTIHFLNYLRELSGGKPIGIRLFINDKKEFYQICHAIRKSQLIPDFIVLEGSFESTGIVDLNQAFHSELPLYEALLFVSQTLQMYGLKNKIKLIADGKIMSCFDLLKVLALGANVVCSEMPRYITLKHPGDSQKLSFLFKSWNVYEFHNNLMKDTVQIMKACGFKSVGDITLSKFFSRLDVLHSKIFEKLNVPVVYPGLVKRVYNSKMKSHASFSLT